jgi:hypothetical protein
MPKKKNLEIEVIEHPQADEEVVEVESGTDYQESDPNLYSSQVEPDQREGTDNDEHNLTDSMEGPGGGQCQSFGNSPSRPDTEELSEEEHKIKHNAGMSEIKAKIGDSHLNDFVSKRGNKDKFNKTTKLRNGHEVLENTEEDGLQYSDELPDDEKVDDDLVEKQQREAEELLEETKKTMNEEDQDQSLEEEEDEVEEIAKMAKENRINEMNAEEEEEEDEIEQTAINSGKKFELNYTVGRIEDGAAILISKDHNLIEIPL